MQLNLWQYWVVVEILSTVVLWPFFVLKGRPSWQAAVPFLKTWVMLDLTERPKGWMLLYWIPVVNHVMYLISLYELLHVFGKRKWADFGLSVVTLGLYAAWLAFKEKPAYIGKNKEAMHRQLGELLPAGLFAVVAASVIRAFGFEAYTIPTSSMEKSLMVGDFLFVSKLHYGSRLPMTPLSLPLLHAEVPFLKVPSFSRAVAFPYLRTPRLHPVRRNESVVFNYPMESDLPVDKRANYVKRCVGIPGDSLRVVDGQVLIDGAPLPTPPRADPQMMWYVEANGTQFNRKELKERFDMNYLTQEEQQKFQEPGDVLMIGANHYITTLSQSATEEFKQLPNVVSALPILAPAHPDSAQGPDLLKAYLNSPYVPHPSELFPNTFHGEAPVIMHSRDNFGPIYLPKAGDRVELNKLNYALYHRAITVYEGHELEQKDGAYWLDGAPATHYTFAQNYYWMMGDNRQNSLDSRFWGYVPEDHIVGKPVFVWMSLDKFRQGFDKVRTERVFTTVHGKGKPVSYFWPVFGLGLVAYGWSVFRRRKTAKA